MWSLHPDKALRPDGFPISFYRSCWNIIKKYLVKMIIWSQSVERIRGATNSTFLDLIPKEQNSSSIKRYKPISLCNSSYKIHSKVISNRMKKLIPKLISQNQGSFIAGRQIYNNILMVQEAIHSIQSCKEVGMAIKIDLTNLLIEYRTRIFFKSCKTMDFEKPSFNGSRLV